jgi:hypothetical protein
LSLFFGFPTLSPDQTYVQCLNLSEDNTVSAGSSLVSSFMLAPGTPVAASVHVSRGHDGVIGIHWTLDSASTAIFIRITSCANESSARLGVQASPEAPEASEAPGLMFKETLHLTV